MTMPVRWMPLVCLLGLFAHSAANAQFLSDDFDDGDDAGWTRYEPLAPLGAGGTFSFPTGGYRLQAAPSPDPATVGPGRTGAFRSQTYTDFFVAADIVAWDDSLGQGFGVGARISNLGLGSTDGYIFVYTPASDFFTIQRLDNEGLSLADGCTCLSLELNPANDYRFEFSGTGSQLAGRVFDLTNLSTPLVTIAADDATYSEGVSGLFAGASTAAPTGPADATFDNFVANVPEPTTLVLFALGGFTLTNAGRRRRSGRFAADR